MIKYLIMFRIPKTSLDYCLILICIGFSSFEEFVVKIFYSLSLSKQPLDSKVFILDCLLSRKYKTLNKIRIENDP